MSLTNICNDSVRISKLRPGGVMQAFNLSTRESATDESLSPGQPGLFGELQTTWNYMVRPVSKKKVKKKKKRLLP